MTYLEEKYAGPDTDDLLEMATLMDPRFKVQYIRPEKVRAIQMRAVSEGVNEGQSQAGASEGQQTKVQKVELRLRLPLTTSTTGREEATQVIGELLQKAESR